MARCIRERAADSVLLDQQVVPGLEIHPELAAVAEVVREPERRIGRDAPTPQDDLVDAPRRHAEIHGDPVLGDAEGGQELIREDLPGMDGRELGHGSI